MKIWIDIQIRDSSNHIYRTVDDRKVTSIKHVIDFTEHIDDPLSLDEWIEFSLDEWIEFDTEFYQDSYRAICKEGSIINIEVYDAEPSSISQTHPCLYSRHNDGRFIKH